jgi:hypothetical protein
MVTVIWKVNNHNKEEQESQPKKIEDGRPEEEEVVDVVPGRLSALGNEDGSRPSSSHIMSEFGERPTSGFGNYEDGEAVVYDGEAKAPSDWDGQEGGVPSDFEGWTAVDSSIPDEMKGELPTGKGKLKADFSGDGGRRAGGLKAELTDEP